MKSIGPPAVRWIGSLLSLLSLSVLAVVVLRGDGGELVRPLVGARPEWLAAAVGVGLAVELAKTTRWLLLLGMGLGSLPGLLALVLTGRLLNALVPLRAGDIWRVASVVRAERRSLMMAGGSVVVEKLLDGAVLAGVSLILLGSVEVGGPRGAVAVLLVLVAAALLLGLGLRGRPVLALRALSPRLEEIRLWGNPRLLAGAVLLTAAGMVLGLLVNLAVLNALGLPVDVGAAALMLVSGYAVGLLPSGPGQLGVYELAVSAPLVALGVPAASAVAAALALHLVLLSVLGLGGLLSLPLGVLAGSITARNSHHVH